MSESISIRAIPRQELKITRDGFRYSLKLMSIDELMYLDLVIDEQPILSGFPVVSGSPLIPYEHLETGNFMFVTDDDAYPDYLEFGITQSLLYYSVAEMEALRNDRS